MYQIDQSLVINTSKEELWHTITSPSAISQWWTKKCEGRLGIGNEYMFWFSPEFDWRALVLDFQPFSSVYYRFIKADQDWTDTILKLVIKESEGACQLHFSHENWKERNEHFSRTNYCWAHYLMGLKRLLEIHEVLPYESRGGVKL